MRITDFGLTRFAEATLVTTSRHGSAPYMAPELHDPENFGSPIFRRTTASDTYAFGCVCLEVISFLASYPSFKLSLAKIHTGRHPFSDVSGHAIQIALKVMRGERPKRPRHAACSWREMTDHMWFIIESCWKENSLERPSMKSVVQAINGAVLLHS